MEPAESGRAERGTAPPGLGPQLQSARVSVPADTPNSGFSITKERFLVKALLVRPEGFDPPAFRSVASPRRARCVSGRTRCGVRTIISDPRPCTVGVMHASLRQSRAGAGARVGVGADRWLSVHMSAFGHLRPSCGFTDRSRYRYAEHVSCSMAEASGAAAPVPAFSRPLLHRALCERRARANGAARIPQCPGHKCRAIYDAGTRR